MAQKIGHLSVRVVELLKMALQPGVPIYIGESNISHMISRHPADHARYGGVY